MRQLNDEEKKIMRDICIVGFNIIGVFILFLICTSCTLNVVMMHTNGTDDKIDADPQTEATASPELSLTTPLAGLV